MTTPTLPDPDRAELIRVITALYADDALDDDVLGDLADDLLGSAPIPRPPDVETYGVDAATFARLAAVTEDDLWGMMSVHAPSDGSPMPFTCGRCGTRVLRGDSFYEDDERMCMDCGMDAQDQV